jgi:hypothetical protein
MSFLLECFFDLFVYLFDGFGAILVWLAKGCRSSLRDEFNSSNAVRNQFFSAIGWSAVFLLTVYFVS